MRHGLLIAMGLLLASHAAGAQTAESAQKTGSASLTELQIVSPVRPPYVSDRNGIISGPATELMKELAKAAGIAPTIRILPFQRAVMALDRGNTLYPALLRTPEREQKYVWIGEVFADRAVVLSLGDKPAIPDLDAARELPAITVMRGSELQRLLGSFALENFEANASEIDNARLLRNRRVDAWFTLSAVGRATWAELGYDLADLRASQPVAALSFWIAGSANLPPATVNKLRAAYRAMRDDGRYERIVAPLTAFKPPP